MANLKPLTIVAGQTRQLPNGDTLNAIALNPQTITANTTIPAGFNAVLANPITVNPGISFTITANSRVVIW